MHAKVQRHFIIGAIRTAAPQNGSEDDVAEFNSAFYIDKDGAPIEHYDKMYRVPFGEYTPFGDKLVWLKEMIGMGRDLTPGKYPVVFKLDNGARLGVNICYEDVFPNASKEFTRRKANILMTLTNDSWYNESSGAEQHLAHAVFRAVENRRPFLRCGNNSHSCYIMPNGKITGIPVEPLNGSPFVRATPVFKIPIYDGWGETFFTRHGDFFGIAVLLASVLFLMHIIIMVMLGHNGNLKAINN